MNKRERKFWKRVLVDNGCWEWLGGKKEGGFGRFYEGRFFGKGKYAFAHRVAYELMRGPIPEGAFLSHTCENFGCVRPGHLVVGTKLTEDEVRVIKQRLKAGKHVKVIAEEYDMSVAAIDDIKHGRSWKSVPWIL